MNGRKVLLLEKAPHIGGSLKRFYKKGVPFDTGFHFTGGFSSDGVLNDMLNVLGILDRIKPIFLSAPGANRFVFEQDGKVYDMPSGTDNFRAALHSYFPGESAVIDKYFKLVKKVCHATVTFDLHKIMLSANAIDEDFISLEQVLDSLTGNANLKGLLSALCLCYGVPPKEISFANHARVVVGLYESIARIEHGGEAFIHAFADRFEQSDIDILCNTSVAECADIKNNCVGEFVLDNGDVVAADNCIFTIHPHEILKILPRKHFSKAFVDRVSSFENSNGFFSIFGVVQNADPSTFGPSIVSLLPCSDLNALLDPIYKGGTALAVIRSVEEARSKTHCVITAFEPEFFSNVSQWADSSVGRRPAAYSEYKACKVEEISRRICNLYPQYRKEFSILDAASVLTFRDYLFSPEGNAYGIKQKMGQFNLFGKLPLVNIYVTGQSAVLPGIVGAMLSSFIVARSLIEKEKYSNFIERRLSP
ncbi:MAG: NAD(P)/FAD-dependent oxidoreductase [Candidatus Omnitrophica bacterium]|nr:NAD(P)/FAD-dependent oxidoreductase [Candidatus Omnitrophota bacterium]